MSLISLPGYRHNTADYICGKKLKICAQSVTTTAVIHHGAMMSVRDYGRSNISEQFMLILEGEGFFNCGRCRDHDDEIAPKRNLGNLRFFLKDNTF